MHDLCSRRFGALAAVTMAWRLSELPRRSSLLRNPHPWKGLAGGCRDATSQSSQRAELRFAAVGAKSLRPAVPTSVSASEHLGSWGEQWAPGLPRRYTNPSPHGLLLVTSRHRFASSLSSDAGSNSSSPTPERGLRQATLLLLRALLLWAPATLFWATLVFGNVFFDFRGDDEDAENEERRLERFFNLPDIHRDECIDDWNAKEEALGKAIEKLLKSRRFADALEVGVDVLLDKADEEGEAPVSMSRSRTVVPSARFEELAKNVQVSYIMPALAPRNARGTLNTMPNGPWTPRVIIAHTDGALALVTLTFESIDRVEAKHSEGEDGEEREDLWNSWTCTALRSDLVATKGGEPTAEFISEARGPPPHGIGYMRI